MQQRKPLAWQDAPARELLRLAYPLALSMFSMSVMTLVDTFFIGRLGAKPLAAVGLGGPVAFTVASFGLAVFAASKIAVGRAHGQDESRLVDQLLGRMLRLGVWIGLGTLVVGCVAALGMLFLTPDPVVGGEARNYVLVRALGLPCALGAAAIAQWRQGVGDSQAPMRAALLANLVNLPLNGLFLWGLGWGVSGAALASALARVVELAWLLFAYKAAVAPAWRLSSWVGSVALFRENWHPGVERVLDMIAFSLVPVFLAQAGAVHVAGHQIVLQIMLLSFLPLFAVSESVSILVSQALGAGRPRLVRTLVRLGSLVGLTFAGSVGLLCVGFAESLASVFTSDPELVQVTAAGIRVGALLQFVNALYNLFKGALRGLADFRFVAGATVACAWLLTPPLTWLLAIELGWGLAGAWTALTVEVSVGVLLLGRRLRRLAPPVDGVPSSTSGPKWQPSGAA